MLEQTLSCSYCFSSIMLRLFTNIYIYINFFYYLYIYRFEFLVKINSLLKKESITFFIIIFSEGEDFKKGIMIPTEYISFVLN